MLDLPHPSRQPLLTCFAVAAFATLLTSSEIEARAFHSGLINSNQTWLASDTVHVITNDVTVAPGITLTIEPGCVIKLQVVNCATYAALLVDGTLIASGTQSQPIVFTSYEDDAAGGDTNGDGSASVPGVAEWEKLRFSNLSTNSTLRWCTIRYGGRSSSCSGTNSVPMVEIVGCAPTFDNCVISTSYSHAVSLSAGAAAMFDSCTIASANGYALLQTLDSDPQLSHMTFLGSDANGLGVLPGTTSGARVWRSMGVPYVLSGDIVVGTGSSLTVQPGCVVKLRATDCANFASLIVDGALLASGTAQSPIHFTSFEDDVVGGDTNNDGSGSTPGMAEWEQIRFSALSGANSTMDYCIIRYGGRSSSCSGTNAVPMVAVNGARPLLRNCTISTSYTHGVSLTSGATPTIANSSILSANGYAITQTLDCAPTLSSLTLVGSDANGVGMLAGTVSGNAVWPSVGVPYVLAGDIVVGIGAHLTVSPGVVVKLRLTDCANFASLVVDGSISAEGTLAAPIVFTSFSDDQAGGDTNNDGSATAAAAGQWERIRFSDLGTGSVMRHCTVRYGGRSSNCSGTNAVGMVEVSGTATRFEDCTFSSAYDRAIGLGSGAAPVLLRCTISGSSGYAVTQSLDSAPDMSNVMMSNNDGNGIALPGGTLTGNQVWRARGNAYVLTGDVVVGSGATLTVEPGTVVKLRASDCANYAALLVDGTLQAVGAPAQHIYFTAYEDDAVGGDTNNDGSASSASAGRWEKLRFSSLSSGSRLDYCTLRYGGRSSSCSGTNAVPQIEIAGTSPHLDHCVMSNGLSTLIECSAGASPVVTRSSILSSTTVFGLNNTSTSVNISAQLNWWGASSGPLDTSALPPLHNPGGLGSRVSDYVDYGNWQLGPPVSNPTVTITPTTVDAIGYGSGNVVLSLVLQNTGNGALSYGVSEAVLMPESGEHSNLFAPQNVSWVSVSPTGGSIGASGSATLNVTLLASGLESGIYSSYLLVSTNDPARPTIIVPVTFRLNPPLPPSSVLVGDPGIGSSLTVSWLPSPSPQVSRYRVYRGTSPGEIASTFEVPASQRTITDFALEDNQTYYYAVASVNASGLEGSRISAAPRTSHAAVVLVHGVCADSTDFNLLKVRLRNAGFAVYADLSMVPNDARPQDLVAQLASRIAAIPGPRVNIVAHSMGGLVSREYIVRQSEVEGVSRVGKLVTIATPHHGSDLANWGRSRSLRRIAGLWLCSADAPATNDLIPGSAFLNGLNYGSGPGEPFGANTSAPRSPENLRDPTVELFTLAGTGDMQCNAVGRISRGAWRSTSGAYMANDGAVSSFSAHLTNPASQGWTDAAQGWGTLSHSGTCHEGVLTSSTLANGVIDILSGGAPTGLEPTKPGVMVVGGLEPEWSDLPSPDGTLEAGATQELAMPVPGTSSLQVYVSSDGPLALRLRTPLGEELDPSDTLSVAGLAYAVDEFGGRAFFVSEPEAGSWSVILDGTASGSSQAYSTLLQVVSTRTIRVSLAPSTLEPGDTTIVRASYQVGGVPVVGAVLTGTLTRPDGGQSSIMLFDDGAHGDAGPSDGYYGARVPAGSGLGAILVTVSGTPAAGGPSTARVGGAMAEVLPSNDLQAVPGSLTFDAPTVSAGDTPTVAVLVRNLGASTANDVLVQFSDGSPGVVFEQVVVSLASGAETLVQAPWTAAMPDTHLIRATIDPFGMFYEQDYSNNTVTRLVVLGQPLTEVPRSSQSGRVWLAAPSPNPSRGSVTFSFGTARKGQTELALFDVAGRQVRGWHWADLPAGPQTVQWDGRLSNGTHVKSGAYFLRLKVGGDIASTRVLRLK